MIASAWFTSFGWAANGDLDITVSVYDGQDSDSTEFTLSVLPVNDAPQMVSISDQNTNEEQNISINLNSTDVDDDSEVSYFATSSSDLFTLSIVDEVLTIIPLDNKVGSGQINVYANETIDERIVELGGNDDFWVSILSGIEAGDKIVIESALTGTEEFEIDWED